MVAAVFYAAITAFVALFPIVNPIGGLAVFFAMTTDKTEAERNSIAARTGLYVIAILVAFALGGSFVLEFFGISLAALRIAGGIIVAHTAWTMVAGPPSLARSQDPHDAGKDDIAFTPLAMPMLAGPGAIGVVMALAARPDPATWMAGIVVAVVAMGGLVYLLLRLGAPLAKRLGPGTLTAIDRILGFLILAIAIELVITGIHGAYPTFGV